MVCKNKSGRHNTLLFVIAVTVCCVLSLAALPACSGQSSRSGDNGVSATSEQVESVQPSEFEEDAESDDVSTTEPAPTAQSDSEQQESRAEDEWDEDEWDDEEEWDKDDWDVDSGEPYPGFSPDDVAEEFIEKYNTANPGRPIEKSSVTWEETAAGFQTNIDLGGKVTLEFGQSDGSPVYTVFSVAPLSQKAKKAVFKKAGKVLPYLFHTKASVLVKKLKELQKNPDSIVDFKDSGSEMMMSFDEFREDEYSYRIFIFEKTW